MYYGEACTNIDNKGTTSIYLRCCCLTIVCIGNKDITETFVNLPTITVLLEWWRNAWFSGKI